MAEELEQTVKQQILSETPLGTDDGILAEISAAFKNEGKAGGIDVDDDGTEIIESEQELMDAISGKRKEETGANTQSSKKVQDTKSKSSSGDENENGGKEEEEDDDEEPLEEDEAGNVKVKKDVFNSNKAKNQEPVSKETILPTLSKTFNIDLESEDGHKKLMASINKIRKTAEEVEPLKKEVGEYKDFLAGLPPALKSALIAFNKGEDWQTAIGQQSDALDYSADFDKYSDEQKVAVVNKLVGGQFKELKDVPQVSLDAVKNIFATQRSLIATKADVEKQKTASQKAVFDSALSASIEQIKEDFPDFDKVIIRNMAKKLESGEFRNYFFDRNGNPLKNAVKRLALAVVAEDKIKGLEDEIATLKGSRKTAERTKRESTVPVAKRQQAPDNVLPKDVESEISGLLGLLGNQKMTY